MTENTTSATPGCIFCAIVARQAEASVVYEDETVVPGVGAMDPLMSPESRG